MGVIRDGSAPVVCDRCRRGPKKSLSGGARCCDLRTVQTSHGIPDLGPRTHSTKYRRGVWGRRLVWWLLGFLHRNRKAEGQAVLARTSGVWGNPLSRGQIVHNAKSNLLCFPSHHTEFRLWPPKIPLKLNTDPSAEI